MRRAKIVCTLGPATTTQEQILELARAGMNVARINASHGSHAEHEERIIRVVNKCRKDCSESIQNCLLEDIKVFTKGENQYDDITMIVLKKG